MAEVFVDTSGWANFFVRTEPFHDLAKTSMQPKPRHGLKSFILTPSWIKKLGIYSKLDLTKNGAWWIVQALF